MWLRLLTRPVVATRPRVTFRGTYNTQKYSDYKQFIAAKMHGFVMLDNVPLRVTLVFAFKPSKSYKRNKYPTPSGDIDNYVKAILDAANGIIYEDDVLVTELNVKKIYDDYDYVEIMIEEI